MSRKLGISFLKFLKNITSVMADWHMVKNMSASLGIQGETNETVYSRCVNRCF